MESLAPMKERVHDWAERLDLKELLDLRPQDLSGGQKQRVSLAGVLIDESPIQRLWSYAVLGKIKNGPGTSTSRCKVWIISF